MPGMVRGSLSGVDVVVGAGHGTTGIVVYSAH